MFNYTIFVEHALANNCKCAKDLWADTHSLKINYKSK